VIAVSVVMLAIGVACWLLLWRFTSAILVVPLAVNALALALVGRAPAAARYQRSLARRLAGGSAHRWTGARVAVHSVASLAIGAVAWTLLAYLPLFAVGNLALPLLRYTSFDAPAHGAPAYGGPAPPWDLWLGIHRVPYHGSFWASTFYHSNGGPTVAGAWAYHAGQFLVTFLPLFAWVIRGLTRQQAWLTQALLGGPAPDRPAATGGTPAPWPLAGRRRR
jgi:hypothetical protein